MRRIPYHWETATSAWKNAFVLLVPGKQHGYHTPRSSRHTFFWLCNPCTVPFVSFTGSADKGARDIVQVQARVLDRASRWNCREVLWRHSHPPADSLHRLGWHQASREWVQKSKNQSLEERLNVLLNFVIVSHSGEVMCMIKFVSDGQVFFTLSRIFTFSPSVCKEKHPGPSLSFWQF